MNLKKFGFRKAEKLCSRKVISSLFENGESFFAHPFKVIWMFDGPIQKFPARLAISVPRKTFKKAVQRNRIKRLVREAWRHNKHELYAFLEQENFQLVIMMIYNGKDIPEYEKLTENIRTVISKFSLILTDSHKETG